MKKTSILIGGFTLFLVGAMAVWYAAKRSTPEFLSAPAPGYETLVRAAKAIGDNSPNPDTNQLPTYVEANANALKILREALTQRFEAPAQAYEQSGMTTVLNEIAAMKSLAITLKNEARFAESRGNRAGAARAYADIIHLGTKVAAGPIIFSMIGVGIERIGIEALQELEPRLESPLRKETAARLRQINTDRISFASVEEREQHFRRRNSPTPLHMLFFARQLRQAAESARNKHERSGQAVDALTSKLDSPPKS